VRVQLYVCDLLAALRVNRGQPTVAIAHPETARDIVVTDIVGIILQLDSRVCCSDVPSYNRHEPSWSLATASRLDSVAKPIPCGAWRS